MLRNFIVKLILLSAGLYGILYVLFTRVWDINIPAMLMVALLFVLNAGAYLIIIRTKENKPAEFVRNYMLTTIARLLICAIFIFAYALTHKDTGRVFALTFFCLYIIYVIMEVRALYKFFKT